MTDVIDLDEIDAPTRDDFRRVGRNKVPLVLNPVTGKHIRYRRTSSIGKVLDDDSGLNDWKLRTVLVGAAYRPELLAVISTLDPEADKRQIRDYTEDCLIAGKGQARQIQGTAVHAMFDHIDLGRAWEPSPTFAAVVDAYRKALDVYGLMPIDVEVHCVNDTYHLAGTLDRRYRTTKLLVAPDGKPIPIGSVLVGDTKTGRTLEYASGTYVTQAAGYVDSVRYDVKTDERTPFDPPNYPDWGLIVHAIPEAGTVEVYWCDINAGREGLRLAHAVYEWRRRDDLLTLAAPALRTIPQAVPEEPATVPALAATTPPEATKPPVRTREAGEAGWSVRKAWLRERVLAILPHEEAAKALQSAWPKGMPGLKQSGQTDEQLDELQRVLGPIEWDYKIPIEPHTVVLGEWAMHPRIDVVSRWIRSLANPETREGGSNALIQALCAFGNMTGDWDDEALDIMLRATLNTLAVEDIHDLTDTHVPGLLSVAFAMTAGTAILVYDENGSPSVKLNVQMKGLDDAR